MKTKSHLIKDAILALTLLSAAAAQAQFAYNSGLGQTGDVLICFRPNSGSYDLVVDAGSLSAFTNLTAGQSLTFNPSYYTGSFLSYAGTNNVSWSVLAAERLASQAAIWVTRARTNNFAQTSAWPLKNQGIESTAASQIDTIGIDAENIASQVTTPFGVSPTNDTTAVVEPEGGSLNAGSSFDSYSYLMSTLGNLGGNFWGDAHGISVEQSTGTNFTSGTVTSRADFYALSSTTNSGQTGTYLGYFDLSPAGVLTYTAGPASSLAQPTITSIVNSGASSVITFTTVAGGSYSLLATNVGGLSAPLSTWPVVGGPVAGTGSPVSITNTSSAATQVYAVSGN